MIVRLKKFIRHKIEDNRILLDIYEKMSRFKYYVLRPIPDQQFIKLQFRFKTRKKLNLENPETLSDKVNWLKLNHQGDPSITYFSDKAMFRRKIESLGLQDYLVPIVGIYDSPNEIEFEKLSLDMVYYIKTTHDSGTVIKYPGYFSETQIRNILKNRMKNNYFWFAREWNYRDINPKIIVEKNINTRGSLKEYKFFCFHGKPEFCFAFENALSEKGVKKTNPKKIVLDTNQEEAPFELGKKCNWLNYDKLDESIWKEMLEVSETVSGNFPFVRVDFLYNYDKVFLGELTFFTGGGNFIIEPEEFNYEFGKKLKIDRYMK